MTNNRKCDTQLYKAHSTFFKNGKMIKKWERHSGEDRDQLYHVGCSQKMREEAVIEDTPERIILKFNTWSAWVKRISAFILPRHDLEICLVMYFFLQHNNFKKLSFKLCDRKKMLTKDSKTYPQSLRSCSLHIYFTLLATLRNSCMHVCMCTKLCSQLILPEAHPWNFLALKVC